jgi:hypothetical protein
MADPGFITGMPGYFRASSDQPELRVHLEHPVPLDLLVHLELLVLLVFLEHPVPLDLLVLLELLGHLESQEHPVLLVRLELQERLVHQ